LDYAGARYFGSVQGRFTSSDPLLSSGKIQDPRTWNRYTYSLNNPLRFIDPTGLYAFDKTVDEEQRKQFKAALDQAQKDLDAIKGKYGEKSDEYKKSKRALDAYGTEGDKNGVIIKVNDNQERAGNTNVREGRKTVIVSFKSGEFGSDGLSSSITHEGSHTANALDWVKSRFKTNPSAYQDEFDAHYAQAVIGEPSLDRQVQGHVGAWRNSYFETTASSPVKYEIYNTGWKQADVATFRSNGINGYIARPKSEGGYNLTPESKKKAF
jgi:hypothetical protein